MGQNAPRLRFPGFSGEWEKKTLGELFDVTAGGDINKKYCRDRYSPEYPYKVYANSLQNKGLYGYTNYYKIDKPSITITGRGEIGHAEARHEKYVPIVRLLTCIPKQNENVDFFALSFNQAKKYQESTGVPQFTAPQAEKTIVSFPSLPEQEKIADFFTSLDEKIEAKEKEIEDMKTLKKGFLQQMFPQEGETVPRLRFPGFSGKWEKCKISDNAEIITGGTPSTKISEYWNPPEIPWLSSGEVHKKYIKSTDAKISKSGLKHSSAQYIKPYSVLIALAGQGKTRGTVAMNCISLTTNQSIAAMTFGKKINSHYALYNLEGRYQELRKISSGDGSRGGLNKTLVGSIVIPCPSLPEQRKIADFFTALDEKIEAMEQQRDALKAIKKGFLQQMFI